MDKQLADTLCQALGRDLVKWILVREELEKYLKSHPIEDESFLLDLNPHLVPKHISELITLSIKNSGFDCTSKEVILFWLTECLLDKTKMVLKTKNQEQDK